MNCECIVELIELITNRYVNGTLALITTNDIQISNPGYVGVRDRTPLMYACMCKLSEVAMTILSIEELDLNHIDKDDATALIHACYAGMSDVALTILRSGNGKPDHIDNNKYSAFMIACDNNMLDVVIELIKMKPEWIDELKIYKLTYFLNLV